jgi:signal transduction histidine kinase
MNAPSPANGANRKSRILSRDPVAIVMIFGFALIALVFYTTDFRNALEHFFYDTLTRWLPRSGQSDRVVVIAIEDESLTALETDPLRVRVDHRQRPYLGTWAVTKAAGIIANTNARAVALLMPEHAFPASGIDMHELVETVRYDQRFVIGTNGYNQLFPNLSRLPESFAPIAAQVAGYETFRSRSNAVVRSLPYTSFRGSSEIETLAVRVVSIADPSFGAKRGRYLLRHRPPAYFPTINLAHFLAQPLNYMDQLNNKIVILGYTMPRDAGFQTTEQMSANTPLTGPAASIDQGISTTYLTANAVANLAAREDLRVASGASAVIQTAIVVVACGLAWEWGSIVGSLVTIGIWVLLLVIHGLIYQFLSVSVPLADTFLATILMTVFAAVRRLRLELLMLAEAEAAASAKAEIAAVQSHFLADFASWLKATTNQVMTSLRLSHASETGRVAQELDFYQRAFVAGEEFAEYLESIRQIPEMESLSQGALHRTVITLDDMVRGILRRFDSKAEAKKITFVLDIDRDAQKVTVSPQLLDAILYNLISNAVKYSPPDSTVTVRAIRADGQSVRISVEDQGPGIAAELQERIFERFYRIRDERMYQSKGSGLGLYLCRYFAEAMGARIEVTSEVGRGSTFTVVIS